MVSRLMAGCLALAAFAIAIFAGLAAGNAAALVLVRALMAMILCYPVGFVIGMICDRVIAMHAPAQSGTDQDESKAELSENAAGEHVEEVTTV